SKKGTRRERARRVRQQGEERASRRTASRGRSMTTSREFARDYRTPVVDVLPFACIVSLRRVIYVYTPDIGLFRSLNPQSCSRKSVHKLARNCPSLLSPDDSRVLDMLKILLLRFLFFLFSLLPFDCAKQSRL
ncbi:hypothetical protein ALC57_12362, partial [Trachymyrmex cornetzi]